MPHNTNPARGNPPSDLSFTADSLSPAEEAAIVEWVLVQQIQEATGVDPGEWLEQQYREAGLPAAEARSAALTEGLAPLHGLAIRWGVAR